MDLAQSREENFGKDSHLLRNQIINEYLPYVKRIVNRIAVHLPPTIEIDDLINVGVIGLIQAIERYDPTRDNKFITYAVFRIKGAVLSELRSRDYLGRTTRRKIRDLEKAYLKLEQRLGREVTDEEVAAEMEMDLDQFYKVKRMSSISFVSFEEIGYASRGDAGEIASSVASGDPDDALSLTTMKEIKNTIANNIDLLPEKERLVISLYYSDELTMKEIGEVLNITESRVPQIHAQAIIHLRGTLRREGLLEDYDHAARAGVSIEKGREVNPMLHASYEILGLAVVASLAGIWVVRRAVRRLRNRNEARPPIAGANSESVRSDIEHRALMFLMSQKTDSVLAALADAIDRERQKLGVVVRNPSMEAAVDALRRTEAPTAATPPPAKLDQILPLARTGQATSTIARRLRLPETEVAMVIRLHAA